MRALVQNRVVRSSVQDLHIPDFDLGTLLKVATGKFSDRTAIVDDTTGAKYTYANLEELSTRVAAGLWRIGFRTGDVAGLHCGANTGMIFAFYGVVFSGGTVVFAKPNLTGREVEYQFREACPSIVFCDEENAEKTMAVCKTVPSVKTLVVFGNYDGMTPMASLLAAPVEEFEPPAPLNTNDAVAIIYTTGTTGRAKGSVISHRNIVSQMIISGDEGASYMDGGDVMLASVPFTHVSGLVLYNLAFSVGGTAVVTAKTGLSDVLSAIEMHKITMMFLFPTFVKTLFHSHLVDKYDVSSLKKFVVGGGPTPSVVAQGVVAKLGLESYRHAYGLTETVGLTHASPISSREYGSVGVPVPMSEAKVTDVDSHQRLAAGELGEICVKGPFCIKEYFGQPESSRQLYDSEGFMRTGDVGYYTEDGSFFVIDRIKDLIKCMDEQVAPAELEEILFKHDDVKEVAVVGVPHPEYGEAARAFVVLFENVPISENIELNLRKLVESQCASHKHLHGGIDFVASIPKSDNGKVLRKSLRSEFLRAQSL